MQTSKFFLLIAFLGNLCLSYGQVTIHGRVIDQETREALPFVNIVYNQRGMGTTTSLDGHFTIETMNAEFLRLSYVGYEPVIIYPEGSKEPFPPVLTMKRKAYQIEEITVKPGINPAHRIIIEAFENRRKNNPEMLSSFSYTSYNKLFFTIVPDSVISRVELPGSPGISLSFSFGGKTGGDDGRPAGDEKPDNNEKPVDKRDGDEKPVDGQRSDDDDVAEVDSSDIKMREFFEKQHLFLMESVSEREYRRPGRNNERVIASRVSGFQDPSFSLLATQLQSFSFYDDFISLLDRRYLNPISRGSTSRYSFILEDSMFTERNDTLFVISFKPYPDRNFDGLKGVVYINSNGYAIQNVIAEPAEASGFFTIRVQQNYSFVDNQQWFPFELNTDIFFGRENVDINSKSGNVLVGIGKTYLSDIMIEPPLRRRDFNHVELTIAPDAHMRSGEFWDTYRVEPLSRKDTMTYHVIDSLGREINMDRGLQVFEALASGYIPWGYLNIDYNSFLDFNFFEGLRPGFRAITNERVSERLSLGGHVAWGTTDRKFKYGGEAGLLLYRPGDLNLRFSYMKEVEEAGSYNFIDAHLITSTEKYRRFNIGRMDFVDRYEASLDLRLMRHFRTRLYYSSSDVVAGDNYLFSSDGTVSSSFNFSEVGMQLRFAYREKFMQTPRGNRISMGTSFPVVWVNYGRGLDTGEAGYMYSRVQARISQSFITKSFGTTAIVIEGGMVDADVPLQKLFHGKGSYRPVTLEAANSFATMRMLEFASNEFLYLFFRQNFERLLIRKGNFRPELIIIANFGYGKLDQPENHLNIHLKSLDRGYFETGLLMNNIFTKLLTGYGAGVFYRYGPHAFDRTIDNFAFKLSFTLNLN
jgi:hypothetical protein